MCNLERRMLKCPHQQNTFSKRIMNINFLLYYLLAYVFPFPTFCLSSALNSLWMLFRVLPNSSSLFSAGFYLECVVFFSVANLDLVLCKVKDKQIFNTAPTNRIYVYYIDRCVCMCVSAPARRKWNVYFLIFEWLIANGWLCTAVRTGQKPLIRHFLLKTREWISEHKQQQQQ